MGNHVESLGEFQVQWCCQEVLFFVTAEWDWEGEVFFLLTRP